MNEIEPPDIVSDLQKLSLRANLRESSRIVFDVDPAADLIDSLRKVTISFRWWKLFGFAGPALLLDAVLTNWFVIHCGR